MSLRTISASTLVAVVIIITGCSPAEPEKNEAGKQVSSAAEASSEGQKAAVETTPAKDAVVPIPEKSNSAAITYVSKNYGFTLQYPSDWYVQDSPATTMFSSFPPSELSTISEDSRPDFFILVVQQDEKFRPKSLHEIINEEFVKSEDDHRVSIIDSLKINNFDVVQIKDEVIYHERLRVGGYMFALKKDDLLLYFVADDDTSNYERVFAIIKQMIASLRF